MLRSANDGDDADGGEDPRREQHAIGVCLFAACCVRVVCSVWEHGVRGYKTRVHVYPVM